MTKWPVAGYRTFHRRARSLMHVRGVRAQKACSALAQNDEIDMLFQRWRKKLWGVPTGWWVERRI